MRQSLEVNSQLDAMDAHRVEELNQVRGGVRIHFILLGTFILFWTPGINTNEMTVHGFWPRAGCGPIFVFVRPRRGLADMFLLVWLTF